MKRAAKRKAQQFTVILQRAEAGGYVVHVPALPGCHTQGETLEEAEKNANEAIECYLLSMKEIGEDVPEEQAGTRVISIATEIDLTK